MIFPLKKTPSVLTSGGLVIIICPGNWVVCRISYINNIHNQQPQLVTRLPWWKSRLLNLHHFHLGWRYHKNSRKLTILSLDQPKSLEDLGSPWTKENHLLNGWKKWDDPPLLRGCVSWKASSFWTQQKWRWMVQVPAVSFQGEGWY